MADDMLATIQAAEAELVDATAALEVAHAARSAAAERATAALAETQRLYREHQDAYPELPLYEHVNGRMLRRSQEAVDATLAEWAANREKQLADKAAAEKAAADDAAAKQAAFEAAVSAEVARQLAAKG